MLSSGTKDMETALDGVAKDGDLKNFLKCWREYGEVKPKNKEGETPIQLSSPLHQAAYNGNLAICEAILKKESDPQYSDEDGYTPLYWAAKEGHLDVVKFFLEKGHIAK